MQTKLDWLEGHGGRSFLLFFVFFDLGDVIVYEIIIMNRIRQ